MRRIMLALMCLFMSVPAWGQFITVEATQLTDSSGNLVSNAVITFAPTLLNGTPTSYRKTPSGGQVVTTPVSANVVSGAFSIVLSDTGVSSPLNFCYNVTVTDNTTGNNILGGGYSCVQPTGFNSWCGPVGGGGAGFVCNFDAYTPNLLPLAQQQTGPTGPTGLPGPTGATGAPGGSLSYPGVTSNGNNGLTVTGDTAAPRSFTTGMGSVYIASPPYNASCSATATTTSGTVTPSSTIPVASSATFSVGQGIFIQGASVVTGDYIGTVTLVVGNTISVTPATTVSVTNALVQHDETAALNLAIANVASGTAVGAIRFPAGTCNLNGPLQQTSFANAVIPLPNVPASITLWGPGLTIDLEGVSMPYFDNTLVPSATLKPQQGGTIIQTTRSSGNLIGAKNTVNGSWGNMVGVRLIINNLTFRAPQNPGITMVNAGFVDEFSAPNVEFDVWQGVTTITGLPAQPTNINGIALFLPVYDNQADVNIGHMQATGYNTCLKAGEHTYIDNAEFNNCWIALDATTGGHGVHANQLLMQGNAYGLTATAAAAVVIEHLEIEGQVNGWIATAPHQSIIYDPTNLLSGYVGYVFPTQPFNYGSLSQYGGGNLTVVNLLNIQSSGMTVDNFPSTNLGSNWKTISGSLAINSGVVNGAASGATNAAIWQAGGFGPDQCSTVNVGTPTGVGGGPSVMMSNTNSGSFLDMYQLQGTSSGTELYIAGLTGGTVLAPTLTRLPNSSAVGPGVVSGDRLTLCHTTNGALTSYKNGVLISALSTTDTTLLVGQPGFSIFDTTGTPITSFFTSIPWTPTAPAVSCGAGTPGTITSSMRTLQKQGTSDIQLTITNTTNGTCAGTFVIPLTAPFVLPSSFAVGYCANQNDGTDVGNIAFQAGSADAFVTNAAGAVSFFTNGTTINCSATIETR